MAGKRACRPLSMPQTAGVLQTSCVTTPCHCPSPQVQGTVLMHVSTLIKYDTALGQEWLKDFKSGGLRPSPFLLQARGSRAGAMGGAWFACRRQQPVCLPNAAFFLPAVGMPRAVRPSGAGVPTYQLCPLPNRSP